jgi:hypothetical protein
VVGIRVCLLVCLWREPRGVALYILVTEVTAVMKTMICSETLLLPTGPQLEKERAFFPDRASGPIGRGALEVLKAWCEVRMEGVQVLEMWPKSGEASLPCSVGP